MHQKQIISGKEKNKFFCKLMLYTRTLSELYFFHFPYLPLELHVFSIFRKYKSSLSFLTVSYN